MSQGKYGKSIERSEAARHGWYETHVRGRNGVQRALVNIVVLHVLALLSVGVTRAEEEGGADAGGLKTSAAVPLRSERNLVFREVAGTEVKADLFRPDDDQVYPLVVMIHGGAWTAGDKWDLIDHAREMAQAGYVAVTVNYRLAPGAKIDEQLDDCRHAVQWAVASAQQWKADTNRLALWGYSAGAHLAALTALTTVDSESQTMGATSHAVKGTGKVGQPKRFEVRALVLGGAPCEFSFLRPSSRVLSHVMGGSRAELPQQYLDFSPIEHVDQQSPPTFLFHGSADLLVPISSSVAMQEALKAKGVLAKHHRVEGQGHLLTFLNPNARKRAIEFLDERLKED